MIKSYPKIKPIRSERYKKFIRSKLCMICFSDKNVQAAHQNLRGKGIMGSKVSDIQCVPLCELCHKRSDQISEKEWVMMKIIEFINEFFALGGKL